MSAETNYVNLAGNLKLAGDLDPLRHCMLNNPRELRAMSLRFAIDSDRAAFVEHAKGETLLDIAAQCVDAAKVFEAYMSGEEQ